jgi:excisionase family DNA binding protein
MDDSSQLLTPQQCAARLQCSVATVYRLVAEGELPARRVGRLLRFSPEALHDWACGPGSAPKGRGHVSQSGRK